MQIVYTGEQAPYSFTKSIFLAGPTPRSADVPSWRPEALKILEAHGYDGVVFVPEDRSGGMRCSYEDQVAWEHYCLDMADCIVFWVPRNLQTMPAFTTNVEFGLYAQSGRAVFGAPSDAPKNLYLRYVAKKFDIPLAETLTDTIGIAVRMLGAGALRGGGERHVPLLVWNTPSFRAWYRSQYLAGNRLHHTRVEWIFRVGKGRTRMYAWALHVNVYVAKENRHKVNEVVISRPDISTVLLYTREKNLLDSKVVLVREFRSPGRTEDGFVRDLPGGSSPELSADSVDNAREEVREETGLLLAGDRLIYHGARQLVGTYSAHTAHLFSAALNDFEIAYLESQKDMPHGADLHNPTGERTYIEVKTLREIMQSSLIDWSVLGMIYSVIYGE